MSKKPCEFCGKPTPQVDGRRARKFCSDSCRQKDFQRRKKAEEAIKNMHPATKFYAKTLGLTPSEEKEVSFKKPPKRSSKIKGVIPSKEAMLEQTIEYDPNKSFDADLLKGDIHDEPAMYQKAEVVSSELKLPTKPYDLKKMAEAGVPDKDAFKKHVEATKMTPGERAMIYSKLK